MGSGSSPRFDEIPRIGEPQPAPVESGSTPEDCPDTLENVELEEVERCPYFEQHGIPPNGTDVLVSGDLEEGRIACKSAGSGETIGYMPVEHSKLFRCFTATSYIGEVVNSATEPIARVWVDLRQ
jgi:hypothetical protein